MADLGSNTSLVTALSEIEKKVIQAEKDRNNLETNLKNKDVEVVPGSKMSSLIDKVQSIIKFPLPKWVQDKRYAMTVKYPTTTNVDYFRYRVIHKGKVFCNYLSGWSTDFYMYDIDTNTYSQKSEMSYFGLRQERSCMMGNYLYYILDNNHSNLWSFYIPSSTHTLKALPFTAVNGCSFTSTRDKIFFKQNQRERAFIYDVNTNTYQEVSYATTMQPTNTYSIEINDKVYIVYSRSNSRDTVHVDEFNVDTKTATRLGEYYEVNGSIYSGTVKLFGDSRNLYICYLAGSNDDDGRMLKFDISKKTFTYRPIPFSMPANSDTLVVDTEKEIIMTTNPSTNHHYLSTLIF